MEKIEVFELDDDFDPLEGADLDLDTEAEYAGGIDYQVPIPDAELSVVPEKVVLPPAERIANLIDGMPGQKFRVLTGIRICTTPKTLEEASVELDELFPQGSSVYPAARIIELLNVAGALDRIDPQEDEAVAGNATEVSGSSTETAAGNAAKVTFEGAPEGDTEAAEAATETGAGGEDERIESMDWDDMNLEFDEVVQVAPSLYVATSEGLAAIEERWGANVALKAVADEPQYFPIWEKILEMCLQEGGQTKKAVADAIDNDPLLQEPRRWCQYFLEKLKEVNALEWKDTWVTTEIGKEILASDIFAK